MTFGAFLSDGQLAMMLSSFFADSPNSSTSISDRQGWGLESFQLSSPTQSAPKLHSPGKHPAYIGVSQITESPGLMVAMKVFQMRS